MRSVSTMMSTVPVMRDSLLRSVTFGTLLCALACGAEGTGRGDAEPVGSPACVEAQACGGDLVGVWEAEEICFPEGLTMTTQEGECGTVEQRITSGSMSGTLVFDASGSYTMSTVEVREETFDAPQDCIGAGNCADYLAEAKSWGALFGYEVDGMCLPSSDACHCDLVYTFPIEESGSYTTAGGTLTISTADGLASIDYCVEGDQMVQINDIGVIINNNLYRRVG